MLCNCDALVIKLLGAADKEKIGIVKFGQVYLLSDIDADIKCQPTFTSSDIMSEFTEAGDAIVHQEDPEPASEWTRAD